MAGESEGDLRLDARLRRLEEIVAALEGEGLELEDALELFEEGIGHVRAAREILERSELRIERLLEEDGRVVLEPMGRDPK
ncbi:MAG TPA: exodeoxyribonuclease VII small subunit [Longimicrobiales bacterium]|jgi:exodeoxyribonuclease VII small subunit